MRRFLPDEVFETLAEAQAAVRQLMAAYAAADGPFVYAVLAEGEYAGYVQLCREGEGFEVGYHIARQYAGRGYATEALGAFLPVIMAKMRLSCVSGTVLGENAASCRVLEKCGFAQVYAGAGQYQGQTRQIRRYVLRRETR